MQIFLYIFLYDIKYLQFLIGECKEKKVYRKKLELLYSRDQILSFSQFIITIIQISLCSF